MARVASPLTTWLASPPRRLVAVNGSLAGVYNEKLLKQLHSCIHFQNVIAYTWGSVFNLACTCRRTRCARAAHLPDLRARRPPAHKLTVADAFIYPPHATHDHS